MWARLDTGRCSTYSAGESRQYEMNHLLVSVTNVESISCFSQSKIMVLACNVIPDSELYIYRMHS